MSVTYQPADYERVRTKFDEGLKRRGRTARIWRVYGYVCSIPVAVLSLMWMVGQLTAHDFHYPAGWIGIVNFVNLGVSAYAGRLDKQAAKSLSRLADKTIAGPLVDIVCLGDKQFGYDHSTRVCARKSLTQVLPAIKASDTALLTVEQRTALAILIARDKYPPLVVAGVAALEQIGGDEAVGSLSRIADGKAKCREPYVC